MSNKRRILAAIGPFVLATLLLGIFLFSPISWSKKPSDKSLKAAASSMSVNVFKGDELKNAAMASGKFLPFFGSSELSRINAFHPSTLAGKYQRGYEPFLLGAPGTQSLTHFFMIDSMQKELAKKPVVFILSPQWFVKKGISDGMFSQYYSPLQTYQWLAALKGPTDSDRYLAQRLLQFSSIKTDTSLSQLLQKIKAGDSLDQFEVSECVQHVTLLSREDVLFSDLGIFSKEKRIAKSQEDLPNNYDLPALDRLAVQLGKKATDNNEFGIANGFYSKRIAPRKAKLKDSQVAYNYVQSPEFSDFQLVLDKLAANQIPVLFVIPPVNERWSDFTGISPAMLDTFSKKITYQLRSQGFDHIADFTQERGMTYFMEDTIHLGWRGWLAVDQELQTFLNKDAKVTPVYSLNDEQFLSQSWQKKADFGK